MKDAMKLSLLAAALAAISTGAMAQAPAGPSGEWKGSVSLGASFAQSHANVRNTNFSMAADASRETRQDKIALYGIALYGNTKVPGVGGADTANNFRFGGRYELNISPMAYAFGTLDFGFDRVSAVESTAALGVGAGYYFVKTDPLTFTVFGGLGYRVDNFAAGGNEDYLELLLGEESNHKLSNDVSFKQRLVLYPNLSESGEYRATFDATISVKLAGAWNMNVSWINRYDSLYIAPAKKLDTGLFIGVGAKFGK
jgi:putative salt-induced outer membrane protein